MSDIALGRTLCHRALQKTLCIRHTESVTGVQMRIRKVANKNPTSSYTAWPFVRSFINRSDDPRLFFSLLYVQKQRAWTIVWQQLPTESLSHFVLQNMVAPKTIPNRTQQQQQRSKPCFTRSHTNRASRCSIFDSATTTTTMQLSDADHAEKCSQI